MENRISPVGLAKELELPSIENWRYEFWMTCLSACKEEGKGALLKWAWKDPSFVASLLVAGGGITVGTGLIISGGVVCGTGALAIPVGIPLIVAGGFITSLFGVGGSAFGIKKITEKQYHKKKDPKKTV